MFVLGLLVLAAVAVGSVELILANRQPMTVHMWNWTWHVDAFWLAVIGAALITAAWLALGAMRVGYAHSRRLRKERKELAEENKRLAARVSRTDDRAAARTNVSANRPAQAPQYAPPPPTTPAAPTAGNAPATPAAPAATESRR